MKIVADMHTHTIACDHAYSTLYENCSAAAEHGHIAIASTEHACAMMGAPTPMYFYAGMPRSSQGVRVLRGAEVNIIRQGAATGRARDMSRWRDFGGGNGLDLPDSLLEKMEYVIASLHEPLITPRRDVAENTATWLDVLDNPHIDCLGHIGNDNYRCDYAVVIKKAAAKGVLIEINNHSFEVRVGSAENCRTVAELCKLHGARIVVSSDAHNREEVGEFSHSLKLLEEVGFPEELVVNADETRLREFFKSKGVEI